CDDVDCIGLRLLRCSSARIDEGKRLDRVRTELYRCKDGAKSPRTVRLLHVTAQNAAVAIERPRCGKRLRVRICVRLDDEQMRRVDVPRDVACVVRTAFVDGEIRGNSPRGRG